MLLAIRIICLHFVRFIKHRLPSRHKSRLLCSPGGCTVLGFRSESSDRFLFVSFVCYICYCLMFNDACSGVVMRVNSWWLIVIVMGSVLPSNMTRHGDV